MLPPKGRRDASAAEKGGLVGDRRQTEKERAQDTASSPASEPTTSSITQPLARSPDTDKSSDPVPKNDLPVPFDRTGQIAPPGSSPRFTTVFWEDEGCLCYQVETGGVCVARRDDNHMINGTKLLTLTAMTAGRKGALLKSEKIRHTVKLGPTHLKGVWIPFERALELANAEKIVESLYPLFVHDIGSLARKTSDQKLTRQNEPQLKSEEVGEAAGSSRAISAHSFLTKDDDKDLQPLAVDTVQDTELLKPGILGSLFRSLIETMGLIMKEVKSQCSEAGHYVSLESTCAALLFWGNDLGLPQGKLDDKLQYSPHLRDTCITVLVSIARFVSTSLIGLVMTRVRQEQILQSTGISILLKHVTHNGQQQGFTYFPEQDAEMLCQALRTKIDTLIMLAPSLASPTEEVSDEEESGAIQDVNETLPGEAFAERVAKMLPLAPPDIVARLGTLNWDRYSHILQLQREATQEEMVTTTMEKIRSASHKSGLDVSATAPSAVKVETELIHEPSMLSESGGASHKRAPSLSVRTCNICGKDVRSKATTEWKKHIYNDVLAYTCFFPKCPDTRVFYDDGEGLMTHLKDCYGMDVRVYDVTCPLCVVFTTGDQELLSCHIAQHMEDIAVSVLPSGIDAGEESEDNLRSDAISSKGDWMLPNERATSPIDEMLLKQREMSSIYEKLLKQHAISPDGFRDTKFSNKLEPSDRKLALTRSDDHLKPLEDLHRDKKGVDYITFEYTRNGVKTVYDIHPDFGTVQAEPLPHGVKLRNSIYPHALNSRKGHKDLHTERTWNSFGWALAEAYPMLRGNRGALRKAVEALFSHGITGEGEPAFDTKDRKVASLSTKDSRKRDPCSACTSIGGGCLVLEGASRCVLCEYYQRECDLASAKPEPGFVPQSQVILPPGHIRRSLRTTSSKEESNMTLKLGQLNDAPKSEDLTGPPRSMWSPER